MWGLLSACGVVDCGGYEAGTRVCIQLWVSGVVPCWMPVRCSRSCMVIAPGLVVVDDEIPVGGFHFADWGDDGGGAAGEAFDDVAGFDSGAPVIGGDGAFFGVVAQVDGDLEEGFAGYAGQEGSR